MGESGKRRMGASLICGTWTGEAVAPQIPPYRGARPVRRGLCTCWGGGGGWVQVHA